MKKYYTLVLSVFFLYLSLFILNINDVNAASLKQAQGNYSIPRDGLVGEFLLDGNTNDTSLTPYNGTNSAVTFTTTDIGYQSQSGVFNGSTSKVDINVTTLNGLNDVSICAWAYLNGYGGGGGGHIFDARGAQNLILDSTNINYYFFGGLTTAAVVNTPLTLSTWHFICGTRSGVNQVLYRNGIQVASAASTYSGALNITSARIANEYNDAADRHFNGQIQGVRIYNRVLRLDEIQVLYLEGQRQLGRGSYFGANGLLRSLVAYYDMKGDATDIIGGNNGTIVGSVGSIKALVVAGGGGGGPNGLNVGSGGGGAGGVLYSTIVPVSAGTNIVTVGNGGLAQNGGSGLNGGNSVFSNLTAIGGGRWTYMVSWKLRKLRVSNRINVSVKLMSSMNVNCLTR